MDRKGIIGITIPAIILLVWWYYNTQEMNKLAAQRAQQKAIADLIEQQRSGKIADEWEAQRKAITDQVEQQWNAQLKAITDLAERQWDAQKKAIEDAQNAIGGVFRRKPE